MGSRSNAENKSYGASAIMPTAAQRSSRDAERAAMLARVVPDPLTVRETPPSDREVARRKAQAAKPKPKLKPKLPKRPAPRRWGSVPEPSDMDDYLARVERGA